ncbi:helix-turn-helix domain-containing protein [Variovorax boronicumulans]|uniref:helix-turn-helix domain-containing protein n=1 Tax=Variovorax boronicumulans TaxID=436515 RepID=UPI00085CB83D|nr:helix-turn-helix domain-containing protein [Variovorax boronicumulans]OEZ29245.1 cupin [Variovorax boronicumulans]
MRRPPAPAPRCSIRHYSGEYLGHDHDHAQIMYALDGRMELEIGGRAAFTDSSCGMVIPAGMAHTFMSPRGVRMVVIDTPDGTGVDRLRRFAVTAACRNGIDESNAALQLAKVLEAPAILARRSIDLARLDTALARALHEPWDTARMAALYFLSRQRFHARLLELTGLSPQAYLRTQRLDTAERLLRGGTPLEATAWRVGYRSASALGFALRRERQLGARALRATR